MPHKTIVHKDGRALRQNRNFDFGGHFRIASLRILLHGYADDVFLSGFDQNALRKILVTGLAQHYLVFSREEDDLSGPL